MWEFQGCCYCVLLLCRWKIYGPILPRQRTAAKIGFLSKVPQVLSDTSLMFDFSLVFMTSHFQKAHSKLNGLMTWFSKGHVRVLEWHMRLSVWQICVCDKQCLPGCSMSCFFSTTWFEYEVIVLKIVIHEWCHFNGPSIAVFWISLSLYFSHWESILSILLPASKYLFPFLVHRWIFYLAPASLSAPLYYLSARSLVSVPFPIYYRLQI